MTAILHSDKAIIVADDDETEGGNPMKYRVHREIADDGMFKTQREALAALRSLRAKGWDIGPLPGDVLPGLPDSTRRGVPPDYAGGDPHLCNARCSSRGGRPCRALKLPGRKRCKMHGGMSTGPRTPEGIAKCALNLQRWREAQGCYSRAASIDQSTKGASR